MEYRNLGKSGLKVSVVGLGCNNFGWRCDQDQTSAVVSRALELGVNFFDTADVYGPRGVSEEYLSAALGPHRREVIIATKFCGRMGEGPLWAGGSRRYIMDAVEDSLRRLKTDYIDLYQIHLPDPTTPPEETQRALDDLVRAGKVRYIGHSNYRGWETMRAHAISEREHLVPFISAQNEYHLLDRRIEDELVPACNYAGVGILPYHPLASGFLTGKYRQEQPQPADSRLTVRPELGKRVMTERNWEMLGRLERFATERGRTLVDLAIGWLASKAHVGSVIAGATRPEQVEANVRAGDWRLTAEEQAEAEALATA